MRGFLAVLKADPAAARPALQTAVALARRANHRDVLSEALSMASIAENMAGDGAAARRLIDEAQLATDGLAYPPGPVAVLQARAIDGFFRSDHAAVSSAAAEGARLTREQGDLYGLEMMLLNLGSVELIGGDLAESKPLLAESLRIADQIDDRVAQFYLLGAFGSHAAQSGQAQLAAQLLGAADTTRTQVGANVMPFLAPSLVQAEESAVAKLGAARFAAEFEAGKLLDRDAAFALALGKPAQAPVSDRGAVAAHPASDSPGTGLLGRREADVARLVADGLTNKQIGTRLFISERTVDSHIRSILNKLGFSSRAQIAAWIAADQ
jgi:DNA-binding CsgD family transcriptional regulator